MISPVNLSWEELKIQLQGNADRLPIFATKDHFTTESFDKLVEEGLAISFVKFPEKNFLGCYIHLRNLDTRLIMVDSRLEGYKRDRVVLHELQHAWLDHKFSYEFPDLNKGFTPGSVKYNQTFNNGLIVEYCARIARAKPQNLSHVINKLELEPHIYDKASYDAFPELRTKEMEGKFTETLME